MTSKSAMGCRRHRAKIRAFIETLKSRPCADCNQTYHPFVMDFDHIDPYLKRFNISAALPLGLSEATILEEANKCDVVCSNCHRMRTLNRKTNLPIAPATANADKTHCPAGHPYDAINTRVRYRLGLKSRECIICVRAHDRKRVQFPG